MKKVLMISPFFIPRRRVGALRAFKFAIHLRDFGYQPVIFSIKDKYGIMTEKEENLLNGIPVFSISPPFDNTSEEIRPGGKASKEQKRTSASPAAWMDKHTPLDTWLYLFLLRYPAIKKIAKECDPDIIWATGDPWSSLWLGRKLAANLKTPFLADFRDPWVPGEISLRQRSFFSTFFDRKEEQKIVDHAARLVFTSRSAEQEYRDFYKLTSDRTATIYNSYSRLLEGDPVRGPNPARGQKPVPGYNPEQGHRIDQGHHPVLNKSGKFALLFFGRFRTLSPVQPVIRTIQKMAAEAGEEVTEFLEIHSFGRPDPHQLMLIEQAGLEKLFIYHDPIPPEKSSSVLNEADLLLLTTHQNRKLVIPAKLWDYLHADTPILSITPNPEIAEIIGHMGEGYHANPNHLEKAAYYLAEQIRKKVNGEERTIPDHRPEFNRNQYESEETTRKLAKLFDDLLRGTNAE